jgi:hypothetical protein
MIRKATPSDVCALASLHRESVTALCAAAYSDEELAVWTADINPTIYRVPIAAGYVVVAVENDTITALGESP